MAKKVGERIGTDSGNALKASAPEDGAKVVLEQFTREFAAVLQLTREKQAKEMTFESSDGTQDDVLRQQVGFFGHVAQKLVPLVSRLMHATPDQVTTATKAELLLTFGDKFYHAQEFLAASMFFYENVLVLDEPLEPSTQVNILERILVSVVPPSRHRSRQAGQAYVRSLFGAAMCCFHTKKRADPFVRYPGTLEKMIEALTLVRFGMEISVAMERQFAGAFSWLTLNGTVLIFAIAKPLQALGFANEVVTYLKWSLLAMESAVTSCTTKYILWRLQLGSAICDCYEDAAFKETGRAEHHLKSAAACAAYLQRAVQRLRKEEELEMPLPVEVHRVLVQAETTSTMLISRVKATGVHQTPAKSAIETAFPNVRDQIRAAVDAIETLSRVAKQKRRGQGMFTLLPSTAPPTSEPILELLAFIMEIVGPVLTRLVEAGEMSSTRGSPILDPLVFPMSFHVTIIRHCFQLSKPNEQVKLLTRSAYTRLQSSSEELTATDTAMIQCLLELYEALDEIQQSWCTWRALPEETRFQLNSKPVTHLPVSGGTIPASQYLTRLSTAMQDCVFHGDGAIARTNQEFMASVALQMWREFATPMLKELDVTAPSDFSKPFVRLTCELLLAIHFTFTAVNFEDLLLHGHVCLRLATLLSLRCKARRGSQVVRQCLERINSRRSELVSFSSHFHSVGDTTFGLTASLSNASFSCAIEDRSYLDDEANNAQDRVGVPGTGSQLGRLSQDLCCIQVDLQLLLYRLELQAATLIDTLPLATTKPSTSTSGTSLRTSTMLSATVTRLVAECHQNGYARVLLNIQRLAQSNSMKERRSLADESIRLLQQMENEEDKLRRQLAPPPAKAESSVVPAAPIVVSRSSSAITVKVVEYHPSVPSLRKKRVQYYMVFAKSVGAGTAVSLNSNHLTGSASPVSPPHLNVTISGLLPNESYVFAVAAFDSKHDVIHSIGETSEPVVALTPLPLPMCYGYLATACFDAQLAGRAHQAANYLYNAVISHVCADRPSWTSNPFYRQALKRDTVAQFPIPILNLCIQALLTLCHDEPGDLERDGKLITSSDVEAQSLRVTQIKALEDCRKVSMAIEIACATDNQEAIRVLCFKGYRLLLPLLHLNGSCDGLTFAALVTFYQALHVIPHENWDVDTQNICARIGFELFRIAQEVNSDISRATLPLVLTERQHHYDRDSATEGDASLREVVALFKLVSTSSSQANVTPPDTSASASTMASPRGKGTAIPAAVSNDKSQSNTPQTTPRTSGETDKTDAGGKLQSLSELLQSAGYDLTKVFSTLEEQSASDCRTIEFASKVCASVLGAGSHQMAQLDTFLSSLKVTGVISRQFRATLSSLGGGSLLPELRDVCPTDEPNSFSDRADQVVTSSETLLESTIPDAGADDDYLYRWCGELFFIQSLVLYRKMAKLCDTVHTVNTAHGPESEDCTYELLHGGNNNPLTKQDRTAVSEAESHESAGVDSPTGEADQGDTSTVALEDNQLDQVFDEFLAKSAGCCKLLRLANCWQGLQAAAHQLWNAIWLAWIAPNQMTSPRRLAHLSSCLDALLDMMDMAVNGALNVDQIWFARLLAYSLRAFCCVKDWTSIVQKGSRYYSLCGSSTEGNRFAEQNLPILIYAQQQIVHQQDALLTIAETELSVCIAAFQEQEAKKKKKKSRLVVAHVLSPEETAFRASKQEMEQRLDKLVTERDLERDKLANLCEIHDNVSKAINKSHQALNTCHQLVETYRRRDDSHPELAALRDQIIAAYNRCVILARQKRQKRLVCQALQETGDFHLASGDLKAAVKSWLESVDNAFSTLDVSASWRDVLSPVADDVLEGSGIKQDKLAGDELWVGLQCCSVLSKLVMHASGINLHKALDYALMAAAIFTRFYGCSVPHPTKCFLYGSYRVLGQLWPGRKLLTDPDRVAPFSLGLMLVLVPDVLLQYEYQYASTVMPVIAGYEYVAESCLEDANHVANARRLRVEALVHCGRFQEAFHVLMSVLRGGTTPHISTGAPELDAVIFHDGKSLLDESNRAAMNWIISFNVEQTHNALIKQYHAALVMHILVSVLHLAVAMARHETRYDRDAAIARSAAKKMAQALLSLITPRDSKPSRNALDKELSQDATSNQALQSISWEELQLYRIRADIHLHLSYLAFDEGDWNASKASSMGAIGECTAIPLGSEQSLRLKLDQKLKFSLVLSRGIMLAKCRSQVIACCLAQSHYRTAFETAETAIDETRTSGEEHFRQHLEMQRLQAAVFLGERETAERELCSLRETALATHTSASLTYVRTLQTLSSLLRSKALLSSQPSALNAVYECLSEAEDVLNALLEHDGWMGVDSNHSSALDKRLNLYRPAIPAFVQVHVELAKVLLEWPRNLASESAHTRQERALRSVERGVRALEHTTQRMSATKARLLLLKGVLLSKALSLTATSSRVESVKPPLIALDDQKTNDRLDECVEAFTGCIKTSIEGGYDRHLVRLALLELVNLFGQKLVPGYEDAHAHAAFHYLNLALDVQEHESVLFDTLELQNGTVTSVEKLPASVCASITAQSDGSVPHPNTKAPDVGAIVNYFVCLLRTQHVLPVGTAALQETCALLHSFLVQYHSSYARLACLTNLPPVPSTDPEIRAGLVCALWGQELAPALVSVSGKSAHNTKLTLHFTLGTSKLSITEGSLAARNEAAMARMKKLASSPLLSKRGNLDRQSVQHLKTTLSSLRMQMEDDDSLLIDRSAFSKTFHLILCEIQQLFRGTEQRSHSDEDARQDPVKGETREADSKGDLHDAFGNTISIDCTLAMVRHLEDLFSINKGANIADNELCYFLRDLLD